MTQPGGTPAPITLEAAWRRLMQNMGGVNVQRARDAKKAAQHVRRLRGSR